MKHSNDIDKKKAGGIGSLVVGAVGTAAVVYLSKKENRDKVMSTLKRYGKSTKKGAEKVQNKLKAKSGDTTAEYLEKV
jgi:hypothetical protein